MPNHQFARDLSAVERIDGQQIQQPPENIDGQRVVDQPLDRLVLLRHVGIPEERKVAERSVRNSLMDSTSLLFRDVDSRSLFGQPVQREVSGRLIVIASRLPSLQISLPD